MQAWTPPDEERFDIHLTRGCVSAPQLGDLSSQVPALALPEVEARMCQRLPGAGFLGLDMPRAVAERVLERLRAAGAQGELLSSRYRIPRITLTQALALAIPALTSQAARDFPGYTFGQPRFWDADARWWVFGATSPQLVAEGHIPGAVVTYVDKVDGHIWTPDEIAGSGA